MRSKREIVAKNDRSLINHVFVTSTTTAVIAIYAHDNSRTIYIESTEEERAIIKYSIAFPAGSFASDVVNGWTVSNLSFSMDTAAEIRALRTKSDTFKEIQVSHADMLSFRADMDAAAEERFILNGEQDDAIKEGLSKIGQTIEFSQPRGCVIA